MKKTELLYEGKAKKVYGADSAWKNISAHELVVIEFKDSLTAFNALKKGEFAHKGSINKEITDLLFGALAARGVQTHWLESLSTTEVLAQRVEIIPLEVVVRNILAGSTAKKFGLPEGRPLKKPLVEFYYKNDELQDPFMSDDQALMLEITTPIEIAMIKTKALEINQIVKEIFAKIQIELVDFKIEFGRTSRGEIILADELTPDCSRLWDRVSGEKLDKDRFRRDLGKVEESYKEVLQRLKGALS